jgi:hypothetical protein
MATNTDTNTNPAPPAAAKQLPAFRDIPPKWSAPVDSQCAKCKKEFEDMTIQFVRFCHTGIQKATLLIFVRCRRQTKSSCVQVENGFVIAIPKTESE